jgi:lipopolysaccharide export system permease protein
MGDFGNMRILDKYILKELAGPFLFGVAAIASVFIGSSTLFRIAQYITQYGASLSSVTKMFIYNLPGIIVLTFPISMLLASLMSFGRLSASGEITAMKSGGISFFRLAAPVFIAAFVISLITVVINEKVVPAAKQAYNYTVRVEIMKNFQPRSQEHIIIKDISRGNMERLIYARKFDQNTGIMSNVTMQEFREDKLVRIQNAEKVVWQKGQWIMYDGTINELSKDERRIERTLTFKEQVMPVARTPANVAMEQKAYEEMTIRELKQQIQIMKLDNNESGKYQVELHQRVSIPMACFIFALIGAPLGVTGNRSSTSIGFGISVVIIFIYYMIMAIFATMGQGGAIPAFIAAWMPNFVAMIAGGYLIYRVSR